MNKANMTIKLHEHIQNYQAGHGIYDFKDPIAMYMEEFFCLNNQLWFHYENQICSSQV
jgi:hypothetical protein